MDDENYLEGLREADRVAAVGKARHDWARGAGSVEDWEATEQNWAGITPRQTPTPRAGRYGEETSKGHLVGNERDYIQGLSSQDLAPHIKPDNRNVGQQLAEHVNALSNLVARRPAKDYAVYAKRRSYQSDDHGDYVATLVHVPTQTEVGNVVWSGRDGHVGWLGVNEGHRHATNYLVTQAWNHARVHGEYGPAASDSLSKFSAKTMRRHNPDATEYKQYLRNQDMDDEFDHRVCEACNGDGVVRVRPHSSDDGKTVHYRYSNGDRLNVQSYPNTTEGVALSRTHFRNIYGSYEDFGAGIEDKSTGNSHHWFSHQIDCPHCNGQGTIENYR